MLESCMISKWSGIWIPFKYHTKFSLVFRPPFEYRTSECSLFRRFCFSNVCHSDPCCNLKLPMMLPRQLDAHIKSTLEFIGQLLLKKGKTERKILCMFVNIPLWWSVAIPVRSWNVWNVMTGHVFQALLPLLPSLPSRPAMLPNVPSRSSSEKVKTKMCRGVYRLLCKIKLNRVLMDNSEC